MMKKLLVTTVFVLAARILTFGQANFKEAVIYHSDKDSISGLIDFKEWDNNPERVTFK